LRSVRLLERYTGIHDGGDLAHLVELSSPVGGP